MRNWCEKLNSPFPLFLCFFIGISFKRLDCELFYLPRFDFENTVCKAFPHFAQKIRDLAIKREKNNMAAAEELHKFVQDLKDGKRPSDFSPRKGQNRFEESPNYNPYRVESASSFPNEFSRKNFRKKKTSILRDDLTTEKILGDYKEAKLESLFNKLSESKPSKSKGEGNSIRIKSENVIKEHKRGQNGQNGGLGNRSSPSSSGSDDKEEMIPVNQALLKELKRKNDILKKRNAKTSNMMGKTEGNRAGSRSNTLTFGMNKVPEGNNGFKRKRFIEEIVGQESSSISSLIERKDIYNEIEADIDDVIKEAKSAEKIGNNLKFS